MKRILPHPLLWLALVAMWLTLMGSLAPGQVLLGIIVATVACWAVVPLEPPKARLRKIGTIAQLLGIFAMDVMKSNFAVILLILSGRAPRSAFVRVPLELKDPNGLAVLSCIVTATPGSAWVHHDTAAGEVVIHVLDTADEAAWNVTLKRTYEQRLL